MEENFNLENFSDNDAFSFSSGMYKGQTIREKIEQFFLKECAENLYNRLQNAGVNINPGVVNKIRIYSNWFEQGIDCEVLKIASPDWQKGKLRIKITIEFEPDEIESPLDPIRKEITQNLNN